MTWLPQACLAIAILATIVALIQTARLDVLHRCATRVADRAAIYRDALSYISRGKAFPHDDRFAEAVLDGNDIALRHGFDSFERFRATIDQHWEQDYG